MAKKPRKKITNKIKIRKSDWVLTKLIDDQMGVWAADSYELCENKKEDERTSLKIIGCDHKKEHLFCFFDLIYYFVYDIPETDYSFDVYGRHYKALQALADIEKTYRVIERTIDFDVKLSDKLKTLKKDLKSGGPVRRILTDQEYDHLRSIEEDARLFEVDPNAPLNDLFHLLLKADRSIQDHEAVSADVLTKLNNFQRLRSAGTPREYSKKLLVILLAEAFEKFNQFGHKASIHHKGKFERIGEKYDSYFWRFMKLYLSVVGISAEFYADNKMADSVRKILKSWRGNRNKFRRIIKGDYSKEEVSEIIKNIDKYIK